MACLRPEGVSRDELAGLLGGSTNISAFIDGVFRDYGYRVGAAGLQGDRRYKLVSRWPDYRGGRELMIAERHERMLRASRDMRLRS